MSWDTDFQLVDVAQRLIETRLRVERLRIAQRLQALEARVTASGGAPLDLSGLRKALVPPSPPAPDRVDRALVLPRKLAGVWRKRYLTVQTKPGSIF